MSEGMYAAKERRPAYKRLFCHFRMGAYPYWGFGALSVACAVCVTCVVCVCDLQVTEKRPSIITALDAKLQHFVFVNTDTMRVRIVTTHARAVFGFPVSEQPQALRSILQLLRRFQARSSPAKARFTVELCGWQLNPQVVHELRGLPSFDFRASLCLRECSWPSPDHTYKVLASTLPSCCNNIQIQQEHFLHSCKAAHLIALCQGAAQRPKERLRVSAVERAVDEQGLSRAVKVEWCEGGFDTEYA